MNLHPCTQYAKEAVKRHHVVGQSELLACKRHLHDLERQGSEEFPWVFDEVRANKIYNWFLYCVHLAGEKARQPIELEPFQKFDLGCVFGWVHKDTGFRRFEKAFILEARKNGKSTTMSGIALYLMAGDQEEDPEVYTAAVDREQARIVYRAAKEMALKSKDIRKRLKIRDFEIGHISRGGKMRPLSKDTKNKDGLHPSGVIIDEYHAHSSSEIYDLLSSASGQRNQALMMIISTSGFEVENNACHTEYEYCKQVLQGLITNERYFIMIREMDPGDDEHNSKNWIKANPLRAATPEGLARLQAQHDEAFDSKDPAKIRTFRVKNLNIWVNEKRDGYMGEAMSKYDSLGISREEFAELTKGLPCLAGVDLSKKVDLTAAGFVFALEDDRVAVTAMAFMPSESVVRHEKTDKIPYRQWGRDGWVRITDGEVTDYRFIKTYIHDAELENGWKVHEFCYDPYNATHFAGEMAEDGYTTVEIRQGVRTLSEPTKLLRELVATGRLVHDGNPILKWCLANAVVETDSNENIKLSKKNASDTKRIDLAAALVNALVRLAALKGMSGRDISDQILSEDWGM